MNPTIECPCCSGSGRIEQLTPVPLPPMQLRIYEVVRRAKYGISSADIADAVYSGTRGNGPEAATRSVRVQINRANKHLAEANLQIAARTKGVGSLFRLHHLSSGATSGA